MNNSRIDIPLSLPIYNIKQENDITTTLTFLIPEDISFDIKPGQYFMLWHHNDDEIPISVSNFVKQGKKQLLSFTIRGLGKTSTAIIKLKKGDLLGLRGPFGNGFTILPEKKVLIIAGGMGIAPLRYLIFSLLKKNIDITIFYGAKTEKGLLFLDELNRIPINHCYCTDDGSYGYHGFPTILMNDTLEKSINRNELEIYSCGPEKMLAEVLNITTKYGLEQQTQISLADRHVRCGFGLCGSCYLDGIGLSICKDGPVFTGDVLKHVSDFGSLGRKASGLKYQL